MLADQFDYVVGVDPHRDAHALAVIEVRTGVVVFEATIEAVSDEGFDGRSASSMSTPLAVACSRSKAPARSGGDWPASSIVEASGYSRSAWSAP